MTLKEVLETQLIDMMQILDLEVCISDPDARVNAYATGNGGINIDISVFPKGRDKIKI